MMCKFDDAESQKYRPIWVSIRGIAQDILKDESKSDVQEGLVSAPLQVEPNFVGRQDIPARVEGKFHAPRDRRDFEIALICALPLEAECVQEAFDKFWEDEGKKYGKAPGDPNAYTTGVIGEHNVVLAYMPGMGTTSAVAVAGCLRVSFSNIKLALVVGICGGMPSGTDHEEIVLGDIIISQALIQYDLGRQYPGGFKRKTDVRDTLGRPSPEIRALQAKLGTRRYREKLQNNIAVFLTEVQQKLPKTKCPGHENDILYRSSYVHQHHPPATCDECGKDDEMCELALKMECDDLGCESTMRVTRNRLMSTSTTPPMVHIGLMGSTNTVMKSGQHRDRVAQADGIIGFEMEGAGVWDYFPSIVIKGVCDYADSHKRKGVATIRRGRRGRVHESLFSRVECRGHLVTSTAGTQKTEQFGCWTRTRKAASKAI
ncbi:hypothetical protein H2198_001551 [Neophaeococcomyces mojaviensis]|uniref:Uncharacterized protein n=1 Tax=Neophaeococcomyces mojaviensis TaxID=3383035 RepID=A0ACC3AGS2_9EURO|nr:hypothetical protein H2198_001551 [Knufia sp. JES_112]